MKPVNATIPAKKGLASFEWLPVRSCFLPARAGKLVSNSSPNQSVGDPRQMNVKLLAIAHAPAIQPKRASKDWVGCSVK
jgi:hypothetical protein